MSTPARGTTSTPQGGTHTPAALIGVAWTLVGVPLVYGLFQTIKTASSLFGG